MPFQCPLLLKNLFFILVIPITSDINLPLSSVCLFLTEAVCCEEMKFDRTLFSFSERDFDIIFKSTFKKQNGSPVFAFAWNA